MGAMELLLPLKGGVVACWRKNHDLSEKRPKKNEWDSIKL